MKITTVTAYGRNNVIIKQVVTPYENRDNVINALFREKNVVAVGTATKNK
ncbi:MAG: hypothetical protein J6T10_18815 [Methanobrevibacter sp.]|nr:hypothetical protein [Methanobrevibacter sp.]